MSISETVNQINNRAQLGKQVTLDSDEWQQLYDHLRELWQCTNMVMGYALGKSYDFSYCPDWFRLQEILPYPNEYQEPTDD